MPSARDPRISVRFSAAEMVEVERAARAGGIAVGALVRECAVNWCALYVANRAAARVLGEPVARLRRVQAVRSQVGP